MIFEPQINHDILRKPSSITVLSFTLYITQTTCYCYKTTYNTDNLFASFTNVKLAESLYENPRRFWAVVKLSSENRKNINFLKTENSFTTDKFEMANALNNFFHSVFNPKNSEPSTSSSSISSSSAPELSSIRLSEAEVLGVLRNLNTRKACGPDNIPSRLLVELAEVTASPLCEIFNMSLSLGVVPLKWKLANITPVFKRDNPTLAMNYRPISLLCYFVKGIRTFRTQPFLPAS